MNNEILESRRVGEYGHYVMPLRDLLQEVSAFLGTVDLTAFYAEMEHISRASQGVHPEEAAILYGLVRALRPKLVLETGTFEGYSTTQLARALDANGAGRMETVDVATDTGFRVPEGLRHFVTFRRGMLSQQMAGILSDGKEGLDIFFHDSAHTYLNTLGELIAFSPFYKPGCVIVCHDAKMDFMDGFGVGRAIRDFAAALGLRYAVMDTTCGLAILRWPDSMDEAVTASALVELKRRHQKVASEERFISWAKRLASLLGAR